MESDKQLVRAKADLKRAQEQLIRQEKLATLGQLAAGIVHEIKNPLNFISNFSEVAGELLNEIKEAKTGEEKKKLLEDLTLNLERIHHHGKRADSMVKNILDFSRTGSGEKRMTNANQFCSDYFELAYHGMRATHPGFRCELKKELFPGDPEITMDTQSISRVLLNVFSNAFYAVNEKIKNQQGDHYKPLVSLTTHYNSDDSSAEFLIRIRDNGIGIPGENVKKIFNPFFTTKPALDGTGLGLSISDDLVKAQGGEIMVNSKENEFTEFTILFPCGSA